jgi:lamin tail-like protein/type IX secretion system substrate protein/Big-like domain-containing protein
MRKLYLILIVFIVPFLTSGTPPKTFTLTGKPNSDGQPPTANIVINQVYGGGGNSGSVYKNDFIELYNNDNVPVALTGWSVQYASAAGTTWNVTTLSGTIPAHGFFLIQESAGTGGTTNLPTPDVTGTLAISATAGKVILSNSTTAQTGANPSGSGVIDKVGFGSTATGYETSPAPAPSNTTSVLRVTDGVNNNNNATDFMVATPLPRNSAYTTSAPGISSLNPQNGATNIPSAFPLSLVFNKSIVKGTGNITIFENGTARAPIDVNSSNIVISNNSTVTINTTLSGGNTYYIEIDAGAFADVYGNNFPGLLTSTSWTFTTYNSAVATTIPVNFDFQACTGSGLLPGGFTQYSVTGPQVWDCTTFGRDPNAPTGTAAYPNAVQMNGYANGVNNLNQDWLITPKLDLTGTAYPLLNFWSRNAFTGDPLQLKISTNYSGSGDPTLATWTDLNGKFPSVGSDTWTQSSNINLSAYKTGSVYIAFVYSSTTDDGSRWTLDDISLANSSTPPPPSYTLSTGSLEFGYAAAGNNTVKTITVTGNDLTSDITLATTAGSSFQVSSDGTNFGSSATILQTVANNTTQTIYLRFAPSVTNKQFSDSLSVTISDTTANVYMRGNSINPASTLSIVDWNLNWFGTPDPTLGPTDKNLQEQNVGAILPTLGADIYALEEVVNEPALAAIVQTMPGYAYIVGQYGSYSNAAESSPSPLNQVQKLAFIYNTAKINFIRTDSLLTLGVNNPADISTTYYNDWASGRFPYMLTADVTLSDNNGGTITKRIRFINIHAKANTSPVLTAYARRKDGAHALDSLIKANYSTDNVIILGDYNDDLNQTITAGVTPPVTSYSSFTVDDAALYIFPTKPLSPTGQHSDVNYTSVIDNVMATNALSSYYLPSSATVLSQVGGLVAKYGTTTTDHYPVFTQFSFAPPTPLPVKLGTFTAVAQGAAAKISWTTMLETNSKAFSIERSNDGKSFASIGTVAAKGNSNSPSAYVFYDRQPLPGINYYRLNQIDLDENSEYSRVVSLNFQPPLTVGVSPNPAHNTANIVVSNSPDGLTIQIVDINGRLVQQLVTIAGATSIPIDVSRYAKGIYTLKVINKTGVSTQKLLVQ